MDQKSNLVIGWIGRQVIEHAERNNGIRETEDTFILSASNPIGKLP